ncbi:MULTISPECIES: DUF5947 family protein [Mycolicibacterium]|nr:DUF5947 family protein [Mycolicibacterium chitae]MCV7105483.1 hypothetical protein [Mycolicibacterium chitae]
MSGPYDVLSRITSRRPQPVAGERCEMCAEDIGDHHQHVVDVVGRQLMCVCRGCYLLFTDSRADLRYRAVPDRFLSFPEFTVDRHAWSALQIPVEVAFFFRNSALDRVVAFYPGAAGACESELELDLWDAVTAGDDRSALLADDVEALLIRMPEIGTPQCFLLPIDTCYEFVGGLRSLWRGFDGGTDVHAFIDGFFGTIGERAKDVPP